MKRGTRVNKETLIIPSLALIVLLSFWLINGGNVCTIVFGEVDGKITYYRYWCNMTLKIQGDVSDLKGLNEVMMFPNTSRQTVFLKEAKYVINGKEILKKHISTDEDSNTILVFDVPLNYLKNGTVINIFFDVLIVQRGMPKDNISLDNFYNVSLEEIPHQLVNVYAGNKSTWIISDEIYTLSRKLADKSTSIFEILNAFSKWIEDNIPYPLNQSIRNMIGPQYPDETYRWKIGDCDDTSILFITMCRAVGVPSFLQLGCIPQLDMSWHVIVMHNGNYIHKSRGVGWHAWSMVYIPKLGWIPVDLTYFSGAYFNVANQSSLIYIKSPLGIRPKIKYSAYFIANPIIYANFSTLRYVDDARAWEQAMIDGRLKYTCTEELEVLNSINMRSVRRVPIPWEIPVALCIVFLAILFGMYFKLKRERERHEGSITDYRSYTGQILTILACTS